jgi:hypothetical protein
MKMATILLSHRSGTPPGSRLSSDDESMVDAAGRAGIGRNPYGDAYLRDESLRKYVRPYVVVPRRHAAQSPRIGHDGEEEADGGRPGRGSRNDGSTGTHRSTDRRLVGAWLGFTSAAGLLPLITAIVGAAVGANLALIAFDISRDRLARGRLVPATTAHEVPA